MSGSSTRKFFANQLHDDACPAHNSHRHASYVANVTKGVLTGLDSGGCGIRHASGTYSSVQLLSRSSLGRSFLGFNVNFIG